MPSKTGTSAPTTRRIANNGANWASRPGGGVAPSRTAAMGATRVARIAGMIPAATVTSVPTIRLTTMVRVAKHGAAARQVDAEAHEDGVQACREREPEEQADD